MKNYNDIYIKKEINKINKKNSILLYKLLSDNGISEEQLNESLWKNLIRTPFSTLADTITGKISSVKNKLSLQFDTQVYSFYNEIIDKGPKSDSDIKSYCNKFANDLIESINADIIKNVKSKSMNNALELNINNLKSDQIEYDMWVGYIFEYLKIIHSLALDIMILYRNLKSGIYGFETAIAIADGRELGAIKHMRREYIFFDKLKSLKNKILTFSS